MCTEAGRTSTVTAEKTAVQSCAACKYRRRKCSKDCLFAPYFPQHARKQFLNAHKLFGVSNISKMTKNMNQMQKDIAMRAIVFQADARAQDPVGGCYRIICELRDQIECTMAEIDLVLQQLAVFRAMDRERLGIHPGLGLFPWQNQFVVQEGDRSQFVLDDLMLTLIMGLSALYEKASSLK